MINPLTAQIIAAIIQVLPLILIPLLLKGLLDSVPVLGKTASNLLNRANKSATGYGQKEDGYFGRRRSAYMNGQKNWRGQALKPGETTLGEKVQSYKRARKGQVESYEKAGKERYRQRTADAEELGGIDGRIARVAQRSHQLESDSELLGKDTTQRLSTEERERINKNPELRRLFSNTVASANAERTANEALNTAAAQDIDTDPALLDVASGTVDPVRGATRAKAYARQTIDKDRIQNVEAQKVLAAQQARDAVRTATDPSRYNRFSLAADGKTFSYTNTSGVRVEEDVPKEVDIYQKLFDEAAAKGDVERMDALAELTMKTGAGGYKTLGDTVERNIKNKTIVPGSELSRDFRAHLSDVKAGDIKVRNRPLLSWVYDDKLSPAEHAENPEWIQSLTPKETSSQIPSVLEKASENGGISLTRARAILLEDGLIQEMNDKQVAAVANTVFHHNKSANVDDRAAAKQTARSLQEGDTYARLDGEIRKKLDIIADRKPPHKGQKGMPDDDGEGDPYGRAGGSTQSTGSDIPDVDTSTGTSSGGSSSSSAPSSGGSSAGVSFTVPRGNPASGSGTTRAVNIVSAPAGGASSPVTRGVERLEGLDNTNLRRGMEATTGVTPATRVNQLRTYIDRNSGIKNMTSQEFEQIRRYAASIEDQTNPVMRQINMEIQAEERTRGYGS